MLVLVALLGCSANGRAENWYAAGGAGIYDIDRDTVHLNTLSAELRLGYRWNRWLATEVALEHVWDVAERDDRGNRSAYGATSIVPAVVAMVPLARETAPVDLYLRVGLGYSDITLDTADLDEPIDTTDFEPSYGLGLAFRYAFVEYTHHGSREGLIREQLRAGVRFQF